jgi:hypothetical protein
MNKTLSIVSNMNLNKKFSTIQEYKTDMGLSVFVDNRKNGKDYDSGGFIIKDENIKNYYNAIGRYINRYGRIGTLLFYVDNNLNNDIFIINDNILYKTEYDNNSNIRDYLSNILEKVINNKIEPYKEIEFKKDKNLKYMTTDEIMEYLKNK